MIGNPFVTILYFFEQIDFFMGGSPRASDIRIVLVTLLLTALCVGSYYA